MSGLRGNDKQHGNLRDLDGGTYGTAVGGGKQDEAHTTVPEGFKHRKGPMNKTTGRREPDDRQ